MIGKHKAFDKKLHAAHDPQSREVVKKYYKDKLGIELVDGKTRYSVDLVSEDEKHSVEVEHRLVWKSDIFPYPDINIAERKKKFFVDGKTDYIILSEDYSHIGIIKGKKIKKYMEDEHLKESRNRFVLKGEFFYKIPIEEFDFVKL
jgi:hypothetical protein